MAHKAKLTRDIKSALIITGLLLLLLFKRNKEGVLCFALFCHSLLFSGEILFKPTIPLSVSTSTSVLSLDFHSNLISEVNLYHSFSVERFLRHHISNIRSDPQNKKVGISVLMASTLISNPVTNSGRARESLKKKKKKSQITTDDQSQNPNNRTNQIAWKSEAQQQVYSSKLLQALRHVRLSSTPNSALRRGRAVREAADRVLAATAKGKTRWSRAILTNRLKLKFMKNSRRQRVAVTGASRSPKKPKVSILKLKSKNLPAVQRKARVLGRLVPGCRKQPLPVVLEEATDYIAALEMQVRAMASLADLLSGSGAGSSTMPQLGQGRPSPSC